MPTTPRRRAGLLVLALVGLQALMVVTLAWCLHSAGADDQVSALLSRLSAAGEWSLLDEIHESTGLEVPQKQ